MKETKLDPSEVERLKKLPETGMGYQKTDVTLPSGEPVKNALVVNGDTVIREISCDNR